MNTNYKTSKFYRMDTVVMYYIILVDKLDKASAAFETICFDVPKGFSEKAKHL